MKIIDIEKIDCTKCPAYGIFCEKGLEHSCVKFNERLEELFYNPPHTKYEVITIEEVLENLRLKFTSGNNIPVERNSLTKYEYKILMEYIETLKGEHK